MAAKKRVKKAQKTKSQKTQQETQSSGFDFWKVATVILLIIVVYMVFFKNTDTAQMPSNQDPNANGQNPTGLADTSNDPEMELMIITPEDCTTCDTSQVEGALLQIFPKTTITKLDYESEEGKALAEKVGVNAFPAYVYSESVAQGANYAQAAQAFENKGGSYLISPAAVGAMYVLNPPGMDDDAVKGDPNAPVTIIEFSDFQCPFCAKFYTETLPQLEEKYINTGKVKLVYRDYPLPMHPEAQKSGEASECAHEQGKFWEMHDLLFDNQQTLSVANYKKWASDLGLDTQAFNDCLDSGKYAQEVQKDLEEGSNAGISGTPGFFVGNQILSGAQPFSVFEAAIEAELAK